MKWVKLSALSLLFTLLFVTACEKNSDEESRLVYSAPNLPMSPTQENPATISNGTGTINATYRKDTKILTWSVVWSGLTGSVAAMHIHGLADPGFNAGVLQNIITTSNGIATPGAKYGTSGSISGTLYIDGVIFKEEHLLANKYYMNIHTATYGGGEIRGQLIMNP
jgi:CHRD domain-containing protein